MDTLAELTDETVEAAVNGAQDAVGLVAKVMNDRLKLMVFARLHPTIAQQPLVEEIAQQSMEALLRRLGELKVRTVAGLRAFASTIVARRVADHIRDPGGVGRSRPPLKSLDSTFAGYSTAGPLWQFLSASMTSPSDHAHREDQLRHALAELSQLRAEYRSVITMAFFDQLTTAQIAESLGVSRQSAAMTLLRAVRALRARMTGSDETGVAAVDGP